MKRYGLVGAMAGLVLVFGVVAGAQEKGRWHAVSSTAMAITGDLMISDEKLAISFSPPYAISKARSLEPGEVSAAFDADSNAGGTGSLYRVNIPGSIKFLHKNTLCGSEDTHWMATYVEGKTLRVAFFSGQKVPVFTLDAIQNSTDLCGTFMYAR